MLFAQPPVVRLLKPTRKSWTDGTFPLSRDYLPQVSVSRMLRLRGFKRADLDFAPLGTCGAYPGPHKHHFRAPNSRASPFLLATYASGSCHSNHYYTRNNLTSYPESR